MPPLAPQPAAASSAARESPGAPARDWSATAVPAGRLWQRRSVLAGLVALLEIESDNYLSPLRSDPRYQSLLRKPGLPEQAPR